tara:strand:- start:58 stop:888 length:831 start_codon:yes stop_codon:yes gene_type:complete
MPDIAMPKSSDYAAKKHPGVREVFRDNTLWILDKPAGVLSHPNPPHDRVANALIRGAYDFQRELYRVEVPGDTQLQVHLVHRLDQETSGLIICTFSADAAASLRQQWFDRDVEKEYRALVVGIPRGKIGEWCDHLVKGGGGGKVTVRMGQGAANAITAYHVVETFDSSGLALLSLKPETGRTHQLRVQSSTRRFPIAGDDRYGDFAANRYLAETVGLKHMFLHAYHLRLRHPKTGHLMRFEAPLTSRLAQPLEQVRQLRKRVPTQRRDGARKRKRR